MNDYSIFEYRKMDMACKGRSQRYPEVAYSLWRFSDIIGKFDFAPQECFHGIYHRIDVARHRAYEMLSRVTPLTAQETLPLVQVLAVFWRAMSFRHWMSRGLILRYGRLRGAFSRYCLRATAAVAGKSFAGQPYHGEWPAGTAFVL